MKNFSLALAFVLSGIFWAQTLWAIQPMQYDLGLESLTSKESAGDAGLDNIYRLRDIYLISGQPNTKVQLSFKMRMFKDVPIFFGYSQIMIWQLGRRESNPFKDIAFNPEFFYTWELPRRSLRLLSIGLEHKSNGKAEEESRSIDRVFVQGDGFTHAFGAQLMWSLRFFSIYDWDETNSDIFRHMGAWEGRLRIADVFKGALPFKAEGYLNIRPGGQWSEKLHLGNQRLGLKIQAHTFGLFPYLMFEAFNGYGESLLDHNVRSNAYRIGFLL